MRPFLPHTFAVGQDQALVHNSSGSVGSALNVLRRAIKVENNLAKWLRTHYAEHPDWVQKIKDLKAIRNVIDNALQDVIKNFPE